MRRSIPAWMYDLPAPALSSPGEETRSAGSSDRWLLDIELPVECVTPVVGGGVESFVPDEVDVVRVPALRGQLRFWWRACQPPLLDAGDKGRGRMPDAETLFRREARTWGGVSVLERGKHTAVAWKSRVYVSVEITSPGRVVPAGVHELRPDGKVDPMPTWTLAHRDLGYALFPLRRPSKELTQSRSALPTRMVRQGLTFKLRIRLANPEPHDSQLFDEDPRESYTKSQACMQLLAALWAFMHFGGVGGRTRRGFGALAPRGDLVLHPSFHRDACKGWIDDFKPPAPDNLGQWFRKVWERVGLHKVSLGERALPGWPLLYGATIGYGPPQRGAADTHKIIIGELQNFRQGPNVGRNPRQRGRPGRSRWPEADWLRRLSGPLPFKHAPAPLPPKDKDNPVAPRAAFGMPIIVTFKDGDTGANARIVPTRTGGRWASPLILRPLACQGGQHVPLVLAFDRRPGRGDLRNMIVYAIGKSTYPMRAGGYAGSQSPIREFLGTQDIDAVEAFLQFVEKTLRIQRVRLHTQG